MFRDHISVIWMPLCSQCSQRWVFPIFRCQSRLSCPISGLFELPKNRVESYHVNMGLISIRKHGEHSIWLRLEDPYIENSGYFDVNCLPRLCALYHHGENYWPQQMHVVSHWAIEELMIHLMDLIGRKLRVSSIAQPSTRLETVIKAKLCFSFRILLHISNSNPSSTIAIFSKQ